MAIHIDLNIILVGSDGFTAADRQQVLDSIDVMRTIYQQVGLGIGSVNRYVIATDKAKGHEVISSTGEARALTADWSVKNDAIDVFVVRKMIGADGWSAVQGPCDK